MTAIILDGKRVAQNMREQLKKEAAKHKIPPRLAVVIVGKDPSSAQFVAQKERFAQSVGVTTALHHFPADISAAKLRVALSEIVHLKKNTGVIVQLPLPARLRAQAILNGVIPEKDVDALSARSIGNFAAGKSPIVPPVVGAIRALFAAYDISLEGKTITLIGAGALVGRPVALWLLREDRAFSVVTKHTADLSRFTKNADIVISGAGHAGLISADMIKPGAVFIDAGTSESAGKLAGDAIPDVAKTAGFFAPVPGGVGPLTVAMVFQNLLILAR